MLTRKYIRQSGRQLAEFISRMDGFTVPEKRGAGYQHMGAIICDSILQAGLNYRYVVAPRIETLLIRWPSAYRTSTFARMIRRHGLMQVLAWKDSEKPGRIEDLTNFLLQQSVDTENELRSWLSSSSNIPLLRQIHGVGPKTVDYIKSLVGIDTVAVDRHIRTVVSWAGISATDYEETREIVCEAAAILNHELCAFDYAIWRYVSTLDRGSSSRPVLDAA
jgi:hypothetical protein